MSITVVSTTEPAVLAEKPAVQGDSAQSEPVAKEAAEQNESTESDPGEDDAKEPKDDSEAEDSEEEIEAKDSDDDKPKRKSGSQRRKERAERAESEVARLQRLVEEMALKGAGEPKTEKIETKPAHAEGKPVPDSFDTHAEYVEALTDWKTEQKFQEREVKAQKLKLEAEQDDVVKAHQSRVKAFTEKHDDFAERMESLEGIPVSLTLQELIVSSDIGPELMYELGKSREEFERICKLPPLAAAREMGKIEARLSSGASAEKKSEPKKLTTAPRPLDSVGKGASTAKKSLSDPNLSQADYERIRRDQMKRAEA